MGQGPLRITYLQRQLLFPMQTFKTIICLISLLAFNPIQAQYFLAKPQVLAAAKVKSVSVQKIALRQEKMGKPEALDPDFHRSEAIIITYFFNDRGLIDSVYHGPKENGSYYKKEVLLYDSLGRVMEVSSTGMNGEVISKTSVIKTEDGNWYIPSWDRGVLNSELYSRPDSMVYKSIMYRGHGKYKSKMIYLYDTVLDLRSETWYQNDEIQSQRTYQWISDQGNPQRFIYSEYVKGETEEAKIETYDVDSSGMVINELNGLIWDPFRSENFFERFKIYKGLKHYHQNMFREEEIVYELEKSELLTFDGTEIVYRYVFNYSYY